MLAACPDAFPPSWPTSYARFEALCVTLQGFFSYWSDVMCIGRTSIAHPIDRCSAQALIFLQFYKYILCLRPFLGAAELLWCSTTLAIGMVLKFGDYYAIKTNDMPLFEQSHTWWHVTLPFGLGSHILYLWSECGRFGPAVHG